MILLGGPGAGKGTQAREICSHLEIPHISTGDILRSNISQQTPLGQKAKEYMNRGDLVPDDLIIDMVRDRIGQADCQGGFLLDGFPRTLGQAKALGGLLQDKRLGSPMVINLRVSTEVLVQRLSGRRICPSCQRTYHVTFQPPLRSGICDTDGAALQQRADDREEAIRERLVAYDEQTAPLIGYYGNEGRLFDVNGEQTPQLLTSELTRLFEVA
ncbi:MAG: adenylate kinase [Acidobacteria bacterium RIFCSPLOWO2_12_FULL_54_10]|nr:MAG: adenylate kinase [Acidobacteria bacterium RIFCSPLOWO2_12_FULL_54_10]